VVGGAIPREFVRACDKGFKEAIKKGSLIGFPVVKVRCVINDGLSHAVDSSEQAFKTAALMGFREAYERAKPVILEPIMNVEVQAPEEFQGQVVGQLNQRRGVIQATETVEGYLIANAWVPLSEMFGYSTDLPLEAMYRYARAARIYDGPDEVHRASVARRVLRGFQPVAASDPADSGRALARALRDPGVARFGEAAVGLRDRGEAAGRKGTRAFDHGGRAVGRGRARGLRGALRRGQPALNARQRALGHCEIGFGGRQRVAGTRRIDLRDVDQLEIGCWRCR